MCVASISPSRSRSFGLTQSLLSAFGFGVDTQGSGGRPHAGGDTAVPLSPSSPFLSLSSRVGGRRGRAWRTPPGRDRPQAKGLRPLCAFPFSFFIFRLISHSTKIASLNSISWSNPNRYYDLLSTIRSQIRQGSILINLETNSKVENLIVFRKRLNKSNNG